MSLEETTDILKEGKTQQGRDFYDQLRVMNLRRMLNYCSQYQRELELAGWGGRWAGFFKRKESPNEDILGGIENLASKFVLMFGEGTAGNLDVMYGNYYPRGTFYFLDREEHNNIITGQKLLIETLKQPIDDPFMNAALIHNEFAKGHQFDKKFGLLFCRLYMNFALMLTGHAPAIIDSSKKEEYLEFTATNNLSNPQPLAFFLAKSMNETYQQHILPILEDGVPSYIEFRSRQDYLDMSSEYKLAQDYFNKGDFHQAKVHIETAAKRSHLLEGIIH